MKRIEWLKASMLVLAIFMVSLIAYPQAGLAKGKRLTGKVIIFNAGSLTIPLAKMEKAFEARYPKVDVLREAAGSRKCGRKITDLKKPCDIMASADYTVIDQLLIPTYADWNIRFATNRLVLCYTNKSKYAKEINAQNWYEILLKKGVVW